MRKEIKGVQSPGRFAQEQRPGELPADGIVDGEEVARAFSGVIVYVNAEAAGEDGEEVADYRLA